MSAPATHPCDACDGTGFEYRDVREHGHAYRIRRSVRYTCPVCNGAGRFPDRMPARDALADAETLLRISYTEPKDWAAEASYSGGFIVWSLSRSIPRGEIGYVDSSPDYMAVCAESAARAAFRAVPGLRGE